jgi:hypothetical protein
MKKTSYLFAILLTALPLMTRGEPIKLKGDEVIELNRGLAELDGAFKVVTDPRTGKDEKVPVAYEFSGKVRFAIARNLTAIKPVIDSLAKTKQAIGEEIAGKGVIEVKGEAAVAAFNRKWGDALKEPVTVDLQRLTESDLNLDRNQIPGTTINALQPIVVELSVPPKK